MTAAAVRAAVPAPGFADPVADAQTVFRAVLDALARPARPVGIALVPGGPRELTAPARAVLLALCDEATPVWLDEELRGTDLAAWLAFHTGAPLSDDPGTAAFAVVSAPDRLPDLAAFAVGTDEAPHTSTTVVVVDEEREPGLPLRADGPGFERPRVWIGPALRPGFASRWAANAAGFPRGIDIVIAGRTAVTGLPRTTRLSEE